MMASCGLDKNHGVLFYFSFYMTASREPSLASRELLPGSAIDGGLSAKELATRGTTRNYVPVSHVYLLAATM